LKFLPRPERGRKNREQKLSKCSLWAAEAVGRLGEKTLLEHQNPAEAEGEAADGL
jgi:hypothetical protein